MVFRKLADVQREKELAERRKDDPPLDVSTDLAVRKLLSRLQRRTNENHRTLSVSQAELQPDDGSAPDEPTGNGVGGTGGVGLASKPSAKLQFAKLLRGTVASTSGNPAATSTTAGNSPADGSTAAGRPASRTALKTAGTQRTSASRQICGLSVQSINH